MSSVSDFSQVPNEILVKIFSYLDTDSVSHCISVNKQWNQILSSNDCIWKNLSERCGFALPDPLPEGMSYRKCFCEKFKVHRIFEKANDSTVEKGKLDTLIETIVSWITPDFVKNFQKFQSSMY